MRVAPLALAALVALPAAAHGRGGVRGDGQITTQERPVPAFRAIVLETHADVTVRVGPARAVRVTADGNLQPLVTTRVDDGVLVIDTEERIRPNGRVRVEVEMPELRRFALAGSGEVAIDGGAGPVDLAIEGGGDLRWRGEATALRASLQGSGDLRLEGRAELLRVSVEGSGDVDASRLAAKDVEASVEGSGDVELSMSGGKLSASVEGSGDIRWRGTASVERAHVSGSGEISRRD